MLIQKDFYGYELHKEGGKYYLIHRSPAYESLDALNKEMAEAIKLAAQAKKESKKKK